MTSMSGDVPNERWESDLDSSQLDDLAAREGREVAGTIPAALDPSAARESRDSGSQAAPFDTMSAGGVSHERWENDLEGSALDREAAEEGVDERGDALM